MLGRVAVGIRSNCVNVPGHLVDSDTELCYQILSGIWYCSNADAPPITAHLCE
jgi:hypothetical protein